MDRSATAGSAGAEGGKQERAAGYALSAALVLRPLAQRFALALAAAIALLAIVVFRAHDEGERAMRQSDRAFDAGDLVRAVDRARDAAGWYFPGAPHVQRARERLLAVAAGAEASGDGKTALRAWGALAAVLNETRHPWSDDAERAAQSNAALARLLPRSESMLGEKPTTEQVLASLQRAEGIEPVFYLATSGALVLMLLGAALCLRRGEVQQKTWGFALGGVGLFLWVFAAIGA